MAARGFLSGGPYKEKDFPMDVRAAVKKKENYSSIVTYFESLKTLSVDELVLLIDVIDEMSEEIFEHYRALQLLFRGEISRIIKKRQETGDFSFLTESEREQVSYTLEKAGHLGVLLWEKYEEYDRELKRV